MATLRDLTPRRRHDLSPLTTSLAVNQSPFPTQTPVSALSSNSLSAPFGYHPATYTPVSAVRQYNPQQWTSSPSVPSDNNNHFISRPDSEAAVPAPPPYSPPRSQRTSTISNEDPAAGVSPATRVSPVNIYRSSPEPGSTHAFPPPPPTRTRAGSSDRPPNLFSGISAFTRRPGPEVQRASPEINAAPQFTEHRPVPIVTESLYSEVGQVNSRPPASRRAASAGATSTPSSSRGSSSSRWEPGMPLPPPPPGPPPPQSRSQSMSRSTDRILSPPTRRPGPTSNLGPVPPTPAGWVDEDTSGRGRSPNRGLTIDTSSISSSINSGTAGESNSGSSSSGLARSGHVRGESKSIRERRNESKARRTASSEEPSNNPWHEAITPADIAVPSTTLGRRPTINKSTPRSSRFPGGSGQTPKSAEMSHLNTPKCDTAGSRGSTPRPMASSSRLEAPTPPFSPGPSNAVFGEDSPAIPPKALPTPPPQARTSSTGAAMTGPMAHSRSGSRQSSTSDPSEQFARSAIERHKAFAQREATATTDSERVRIFADFIVAESRLRRERYATAIDAMGSEILELTRDLFRPYSKSRRTSSASRSAAWTPESSNPPMSPTMRSHRGSLMAALHDSPQLQTEPTPESSCSSPAAGRPDSTWWKGYMPSLSPIPSMSVSEALDGSDSRGRPSSRWWEVSQEGSTGTPSMRLERSKRESKYMGMPRELREALQNGDTSTLDKGKGIAITGPSDQKVYGQNEYPPEKAGWHEQDSTPPTSQQAICRSSGTFSPALITPNPNHLDVSRLVTLPPPYPRHHPAVNNNHPDLTSIRTSVRSLSDFVEVEATKDRFIKSSTQIREDHAAAASKRRNSLRVNIQREIASGNMSYADAAKIEGASEQSEQEKTKEASKADFELFQAQVVMPLNDLLMDRVTRSTELFEQLRSKLFVDAQEQSPNLTQEEGDEQPELLEKLTLLKWIFEAREQLHRELFDLLSDRNDRYRDMVITPYRLAGNQEKVKHAEDFFSEDAGKRKSTFEQEVLKRTEEFLDIIEENVVRGVEVQLSAFWDIAPNLSRITENIPGDLTGFNIQIPSAEYEENPSYYHFPMQYLYSLLGHCEKSTYQFIESQTNLLCLLHEVKSGVTIANCRLMRSQRVAQGEEEGEVDTELKEVEQDEEVRLTDDLKEKVRCVEEQWSSALGTELKEVKERITRFLVEQGGWDDDQ
ncbi:Uncharacterized protein BP5553_03926 [Venustampulla echinocandica]|uniref:Uncharacterized protein n=1 Tax=Venustampulla echinocandica TaxID=2656787 RepID=A0A370TVN0_9HELO|nr:Uncharacterized protein BP5553_03926 [Venustampulla echinocandica]RDL39586.1 Uncharacterized protein BP5553_03926 [Venustampulla echinocandica]